MLDGDLPFKGPYFRRNPTSIVLQLKNTRKNRNQRIGFAQDHFFVLISHRFTRKHSETLTITGAAFFQLELGSYVIICTGIFISQTLI